MDYLAARNQINSDTRSNLLGKRIVLVAPNDKAQAIEIKHGFGLAKVLGDGRLAMANVDAVPAGKYGKSALEKLVQRSLRPPRRALTLQHLTHIAATHLACQRELPKISHVSGWAVVPGGQLAR
jgi:ABC-type molybdate transport system substrate-binding protein